MPLTDVKIRNTAPGPTPVRLWDGRGLYLELPRVPVGKQRPRWRLKYRHHGKEKRLALGVYPDLTLAAARVKAADARRLLAEGTDPSAHRQAMKAERAERAANTFEAVARAWYAEQVPEWSESHRERVWDQLTKDVLPWLGKRPVTDITAPELLKVVERVKDRGAKETAYRTMRVCGQVFAHAIGLIPGMAINPAVHLYGKVRRVKAKHFASVTDPTQIGPFLGTLDGYEGTFIVRCALRLAPLVFVRPGELRKARWADIDLDAATWSYLVTKTNTPHIVPLSRQAIEILRELAPRTGPDGYLFPSARSAARPMSENTVNAAFRRLGIPKETMTGHGFRAMARTILDEVLHVPAHLIEHQLAHKVRDPLGTAYNRTAHLPERRAMMQRWADWLDAQRTGETVERKIVAFPGAK